MTPGELWRSVRVPLAVGLLVLLVVVVGALLDQRRSGLLDPRASSPDGSRALATLLRDRGVAVDLVTTVGSLAPGAGDVVLVPLPMLLTEAQVARLGQLPSEVPLVIVAAAQPVLDVVAPGVRVAGVHDSATRQPACALAPALVAGAATTGGVTYASSRPGSVGCYGVGGQPSLLVLPADTGRRVVLLGTPEPLVNARLADEGNAALALGLLAGGDRVLWLLPTPGAEVLAGERRPTLVELLPDSTLAAVGQLGVAALLVALWRARRLGAPVREPLPVVVRAAEVVEGRGRLYRAARSRDRAAEALRSGARAELADRLGVPVDAGPDALVAAVTVRSGRPAGTVADLLHGPAPGSDDSLVRLADALDSLRHDTLGIGTARTGPTPSDTGSTRA